MADETIPRHKNARNNLTAEYVRSILDYDPETGEMRWKVGRPPRAKAGAIAGHIRSDGYRSVNIDDASYYVHRLAWLVMTGEWPPFEIDHRDARPKNNKWDNLREAEPKQNQRNSKLPRNNTSGCKGVTWDKDRQKWRAQIVTDGVAKNIGRFITFEEAIEARWDATLKQHGEFSRLV